MVSIEDSCHCIQMTFICFRLIVVAIQSYLLGNTNMPALTTASRGYTIMSGISRRLSESQTENGPCPRVKSDENDCMQIAIDRATPISDGVGALLAASKTVLLLGVAFIALSALPSHLVVGLSTTRLHRKMQRLMRPGLPPSISEQFWLHQPGLEMSTALVLKSRGMEC
jgi:hypothetical protein